MLLIPAGKNMFFVMLKLKDQDRKRAEHFPDQTLWELNLNSNIFLPYSLHQS